MMRTKSKTDLNDVTFLIPVRIDSPERLENLQSVIKYIKTHFETNITVLEADKKEQVQHPLINRKIFIEDYNPVFHRTRYLNQMTKETSTPFLAIWDTDVLVECKQVEESMDILRNREADMVFPYDGRFYNVPPVLTSLYKMKKDIAVLSNNVGKMNLVYGDHSVGGAFIVNREEYIRVGMENEYFYGWGAEDTERVKRWEILGYRIVRTEGLLFHLYHQRKENSWYPYCALEFNNRKELARICRMQRDGLLGDVKEWDHTIKKNKLRIGLAVIATGKYVDLALSMIESARLYFFKGHDVRFFIFTDKSLPQIYNTGCIHVKHEPWPLPTLKKFHFLYDHRSAFSNLDFLFLSDADMLFVNPVGEEILPTEKPFLTGTVHPGFWSPISNDNIRGTYENNTKSTAYVGSEEGLIYFAGGFNGGKTKDFMKMAATIKAHVDIDLSKEYIAVWHDESHINRYYIDNPPKVLPPDYCYPESGILPVTKKLLALDKDHAVMRNFKKQK